jgi:Raf kinase inhibitor-like YbhB/YbcL family protein
MKKLYLPFILLILALNFGCTRNGGNQAQPPAANKQNIADANHMEISSPAFKNNGLMPEKYTCDGANINPPLIIGSVPADAKSLVLIMDDPDAPMGTWVHWTVWNINPQTAEIAEDSSPEGASQGITSFGSSGYGGPCPPSGTHRYYFRIYALNTELELPVKSTRQELDNALNGNILDQAELIGLYSRQ